jgi:hypothetical protein
LEFFDPVITTISFYESMLLYLIYVYEISAVSKPYIQEVIGVVDAVIIFEIFYEPK